MPRDHKRRSVAHTALAAIEDEIAVRRRELAVLERARDTIARGVAEAAGRCGAWTQRSPCAGTIHSVWCRGCGFTTWRCDAHGSRRAAAAVLRHHEHEAHGAGWATTAEDEGGVPGGGEAVPLGGVSPPSAARGDYEGRPATQPSLWGEPEGADAP